MIPEDAVLQAAQQLTIALKGNLTTVMDESRIDQLNKLDTIFNKTTKKFRKQEENQNTKTRQKAPTPALRVLEEPVQYPRLRSATVTTPTWNKNTTIRDKSAKQPHSPN